MMPLFIIDNLINFHILMLNLVQHERKNMDSGGRQISFSSAWELRGLASHYSLLNLSVFIHTVGIKTYLLEFWEDYEITNENCLSI